MSLWLTFMHCRYHIPQTFLKPTGNLLVLLEEETGYPVGISIGKVYIAKICGHVSESHLPPVISRMRSKKHGNRHGRRPKVQLRCPPNRSISRILFASYGTPSGDCEGYAVGSCHSSNSRSNVEKVRSLFKSFLGLSIPFSSSSAVENDHSCFPFSS